MGRLYTSFSELSTFERCPTEHYYKYDQRLENRDYGRRRNLVIGHLYGRTAEEVYRLGPPKGEPLDPVWLASLVDNQAALLLADEYGSAGSQAWFNERDFLVDVYVAKHIVWVFGRDVYPAEPYRHVGAERQVRMQIAGTEFIGYVDHDYELDLEDGRVLQFIGEDKTRQPTWSARLQETVPEDPQVLFYLLAGMTEGRHSDGVVYTAYRKPKREFLRAETYPAIAAQFEAIDGHYRRARKPYLREEIRFQIDRREVERNITRRIHQRNRFTKNIYRSLAGLAPMSSSHYPCTHCDFSPLCHGAGLDSRFTYRPSRSHTPHVGTQETDERPEGNQRPVG